ncbi:MAG TPA: ATP-binding protein [Geobacterales bacterium]|nr:ATP-binding protein [Geobacterales bacterium]
MSIKIRVLLVEDSEDDALLIQRQLKRGGYVPLMERVVTASAFYDALCAGGWELIICDYNLPGFNALAALKMVSDQQLDIPFIVVSGNIGEDLAVAAMKAGAHDYLMKGNLARLVPAIERELREAAGRASRRQIEGAIRQGKVEWETAFDAVSDLIILTDAEGVILRCNRRVSDYLATTYSEIIGTPITRLFYGDEVPTQHPFHLGSTPDVENDETFPRLTGWFNVRCFPLETQEGVRQGIVHIILDITRRKMMEEDKRVTDRELLTLYAIAFRMKLKSGTTKAVEDLLFQLHNMLQIDVSTVHLLEKQQFQLRASFGLLPKLQEVVQTLPHDCCFMQQVMLGKPLAIMETGDDFPQPLRVLRDKLGLQAWCAVPLRMGDGVTGMLLVAHKTRQEFSDRQVFLLNSIGNQFAVLIENHLLYDRMKEKAEELERSKRQLKENLEEIKKANIELGRLNNAKNTFIGMASHELKTPLTSILGGLQFLHQYSDLKLAPEQQSIFDSVYEGVGELKKLVEDLLSISRIESQGVIMDRRPHRPMELSREILDSFTLPLSKRQITVEIGDDTVNVPVDEGLLRMVLRNLLENAIKFTPDGGAIRISGGLTDRQRILADVEELREFYPDLSERLPQEGELYRLDVADTGIGIPEQERVRVFDKFYGVGDIAYHSSGKTEFMSKGSGLGLSIVKGIIELHGGVIWNAPAPGGGTIFSFLLPLQSREGR